VPHFNLFFWSFFFGFTAAVIATHAPPSHTSHFTV
jgi:hypothetical protein